jgi:hypothetical protein
MLVYAVITHRRRSVVLILLATIAIDFAAGFLGDSKETAFKGPFLLLVGMGLLKERIPLIGMAVVIVLGGLTFDFFLSYRDYLGTEHVTRAKAAEDVSKNLEALASKKSLAARFGEGMDYFASRITLKGPMEILVDGVGKKVPYLEGETLWPITQAFIPRFILPDKPDTTAIGLKFNYSFHLSSPGTYISVSNIGDLYWNFGWGGITVGMITIGVLMGFVGSASRLDYLPTLPKFLLLMLTVYVAVLRFETGVALVYTYWVRAVAMLWVMHLLVPKQRARV